MHKAGTLICPCNGAHKTFLWPPTTSCSKTTTGNNPEQGTPHMHVCITRPSRSHGTQTTIAPRKGTCNAAHNPSHHLQLEDDSPPEKSVCQNIFSQSHRLPVYLQTIKEKVCQKGHLHDTNCISFILVMSVDAAKSTRASFMARTLTLRARRGDT